MRGVHALIRLRGNSIGPNVRMIAVTLKRNEQPPDADRGDAYRWL